MKHAGHSIDLDRDMRRMIARGRAVVAGEAHALDLLAYTLDSSFGRVALRLLDTRSRVVVSGLGKSGLVGRKIAATLMATGTPALFLHAGDAVHGDMGAITAEDTLLVLSNSGETPECIAVAGRAQALGCPVLLFTSRERSTLARLAEAALVLPSAPEACLFDSSPTTSTTMMLALGDALAVALMEARDVGRCTLYSLHPGGRLGREMVPIASLMHQGRDLPLVAPDADMLQVVDRISEAGFGVAVVVDARQCLLGVITDGDLRRHASVLSSVRAETVMTPDPQTLSADAVARDALRLMSSRRITALVIVDSQSPPRVAGLVHVHDLLGLEIA